MVRADVTLLRVKITPHRSVLVLTFVASASLGVLLAVGQSPHLLLALALVPIVLVMTVYSPRATLLGFAVWTVALGSIRRLAGTETASGFGDPLLLAAPAVVGLLFVVSVSQGSFRHRTPLANAVAAISLLGLVEAVNPLQGSLSVGLGGLLFILVPMLSFWIGRSLVAIPTFSRLLGVVQALSLLAAAYGLSQEYVGFPGWDKRWIATSGYTALKVSGVTRAFSSFSSASEYLCFLGFGLVISFSRLRAVTGWRRLATLAVIGVLAVAIFLDSSRSAVVLDIVALGAMSAASARMRPLLAITAGVATLGVMVLALSALLGSAGDSPVQSAGSTSVLVQHQLSGLADPTGKNSTAAGHVSRVVNGISQAFTDPIGHGIGTVTLAAKRLGGVSSSGTEQDFGNVAVALGLPGIIFLLLITARGFGQAYKLAAQGRDANSLAALGLLVVAFTQWLNGEQYAIAWLVWLTLGVLDAKGSSPDDHDAPLSRRGAA